MAGQKQIGWNKLVAAALFTAIFVVGALIGFVPKASAAGTFKWTDFQTIVADGQNGGANSLDRSGATSFTFKCVGSGNNDGKYTCTAQTGRNPNTCAPQIILNEHSNSGTLHWWGRLPNAPASFVCDSTDEEQGSPNTIDIAEGQNAPADLRDTGAFEFSQDPTTIFRTKDGIILTSTTADPLTYTQTNPPSGSCPVVVKVPANTTIDITKETGATEIITAGDCAVSNNITSQTVMISAYVAADQPDSLANGANGSTVTDPNLDCGTKLNPLNWFICPIITTIVNQAVGFLDNTINNLLTVNQNQIFNTGTTTGAGYYKAWQTFRALSLGLLVIAGLFMVISQALGFEILDAYTIKKILPRLVLAILGIALSWELMNFFVVLTNNLGLGIRSIIYFPFQSIIKNTPLALGGGASVATLILSGGAFAALGIAGLLSFVLTAALALLVAFLVLILRQLIIIVLILFAPIAIACSILPNTQSVYKLWWESFSKAMLMFPIIVAFLAVGRVFAVTSIGANIGKATFISQLIGFAAYFLPYFLIPKTFSLAGGALRTIGGSVNDRGRGGFDRLKKYRGTQMQNNTHAMKEGTRFRPNNALARGFNSATHGATMATQAGANPWQWKSRYAGAKLKHDMTAMEEIRKNPSFIAGSQDDRVLRAAQHGKGVNGIKQYLRENEHVTDEAQLLTMAGAAELMQSSGPREAVQQAIVMQRLATGTGFTKKRKDGTEYFDYKDAMQSIREASGGDRQVAGTLLGQAKSIATGSGQLAFGGASYGTLSGELDNAFADRPVDGEKIALNAYDSTDAATAARARNVHLEDMARAATNRVNSIASGSALNVTPGELGKRVPQLENWRQTTGMYAAPERATIVNTQLANAQDTISSVRESAMAAYPQPEQDPLRVTVVPPNGGQSINTGPEPLVAVRRWTPGTPVPSQSDPIFRPAPSTPAPRTPTQPTADDRNYMRNLGRGQDPRDPRNRDRIEPPEPGK